MKDSIGTQFMSLLKLPGQIKNTADSQSTLYGLKEKLKVRQNQLNPTYGTKPWTPSSTQSSAKKFNRKKVARAANKILT